jgi:hypothetical protein
MSRFLSALVASFAGKILAVLFVAIAAAIGFGPERWAELILGLERPWVLPVRIALLILAAVVFLLLVISIKRSAKVAQAPSENGQFFRAIWRSLRSSYNAAVSFAVRIWQLYGPYDYEVAFPQAAVGHRYFSAYRESRIEFGRRFAAAFPGLRGNLILDQPSEILPRLEVLLKWPLTASSPDHQSTATPFYWTTGSGNMHIERFHRYKRGIILLNEMEIRPTYLAAIGGNVYWQNYVYLEGAALPTRRIRGEEGVPAPAYQEYAVYNGKIFNRGEYDDGSYLRRGKPVPFSHKPDLRSRRMKPFGFLIIATTSPANRPRVDVALRHHIQQVIEDKDNMRSLARFLRSLPKGE